MLNVRLYLAVMVTIFLFSCGGDLSEQGDKLYKSGKYQEAIKSYSEYLETYPSNEIVLYNRGRSYEELGMTEEAIADYQQVLKIDDRHMNSRLGLASLFYKNGDYSSAEIILTESMKISPENPNVLALRGKVNFQMSNFKQAIDDLSKALRIKPDMSDAYYFRGLANIGANKKSSGCSDLKKAVSMGVEVAQNSVDKYCK
ncbi:tetratricopeptide repeat protein [Marinigracilibium pacificum]|uniref:Tetratricopeptide repeat protein n=1 Tax=Marinigracilibium pacificum TaxID=2729599 RepID=A0A848J3X5_9BACT|nr:tetratricopeptide repeat protein [Marinigracilibium pacificum]NMM50421.1 tetratricopeptide repeat protein [Marinigracilibium pacificum]